MLVLTRKENESFELTGAGIKNPIRLTINRVDGRRVRVGIVADQEIKIRRSEVARPSSETRS